MGLTIYYQFSPGISPAEALENPTRARQLIREASDLAIAALEKRGIPCAELPFRIERKQGVIGPVAFYEASILPGGPAEGCETLTFGWSRYAPAPWTGDQFTKTQYAADFLTTHSAVCAALQELEDAGYISQVKDEGKFYRSGQTQAQLAETYGHWMAMTGALHDMLQDFGLSYQSPTPGGVVKDFDPDQEESGE